LFGRNQDTGEGDIDLMSALDDSGRQTVRRASRYSFSEKLIVKISGESGILVDLSVNGAQVLMQSFHDQNATVEFALPSRVSPISCTGRIVWSRPEPPAKTHRLRYRAGIFFTTSDAAAIEAFIIQHSAKRGSK